MSRRSKFWTPISLVIVLTRNRPRTLDRCVDKAFKSLGRSDALLVLDDSTKRYQQRNHSVLVENLRGQTSVMHLSVQRCLDTLTTYLPASSLEWTERTAQRDIAPIRNISLLLSQCFQAEHVLLVDDDISEFDVVTTRHWVTGLAKKYGNVVVGAHIGGVDETDIISRLESGIKRSCTCANNGGVRISARESFTVVPVATDNARRSEFVSGGYLSFKFAPDVLEPFPPGYNEDWLWCLFLQKVGIASVFRIPQVVKHSPVVIRRPSEDDVFFELRGDLALQNEMARQVSGCGPRGILAGSDDACWTQEDDNDDPERRVETLLTQVEKHEDQCGSFISDRFRPFGLEVLKRMQTDLRLRLDWSDEFQRWKLLSLRNRDSFFQAMHANVTKKLSRFIEKGRL